MDFGPIIEELGFEFKLLCYIFITLFGICVGSFSNVVILRVPRKEEFVKTSSHCMTCGHKLAWYDNIPLLSFIMIGGKCRYCKTKLSWQYPIVEAINGIAWLLLFVIKGFTLDALIASALFTALLAMSIIDFRTFEISNGFHFYIGTLALINLYFNRTDFVNYLIGFFAVSVPLFVIFWVSNGAAIGGGDVKLMAACGLLLGWKAVILALIIGCISGSVIHIIRMKCFGAGKVLAMGPYLALGTMISLIYGNQIISWYLTLF